MQRSANVLIEQQTMRLIVFATVTWIWLGASPTDLAASRPGERAKQVQSLPQRNAPWRITNRRLPEEDEMVAPHELQRRYANDEVPRGLSVINFFGQQRSLNHAILEWIERGLSGQGVNAKHYNNVWDIYGDPHTQTRLPPDNIRRSIVEANVSLAILSYEDLPFQHRRTIPPYKAFDPFSQVDVIVQRDFPNTVASRLSRIRWAKTNRVKRGVAKIGWPVFKEQWLEQGLAILAQEEGSYTDDKRLVPILANRWKEDRQYRDELATTFGFTNDDAGVESVPANADGSSFDGREFDGRASQMDTEGRWRHFVNDPEYRQIVSDGEIDEINFRLFGFRIEPLLRLHDKSSHH